jgi:hypothetical protein
MEVPSTDNLPKNEIEQKMPDGSTKTVPNPEYAMAMLKFGEEMAAWLPELKLGMKAATKAAGGLNVLYETMRKQRSENFINEVRKTRRDSEAKSETKKASSKYCKLLFLSILNSSSRRTSSDASAC